MTIIGFDGGKPGKQAILEGKILCDAVQCPEQIGQVTVDSVARYLTGKDLPAEVLIPTKLYYKADLEKDAGCESPIDVPISQ